MSLIGDESKIKNLIRTNFRQLGINSPEGQNNVINDTVIFEKDYGGRNLVQQVKYAEAEEIAKAVKEAKVKNIFTSTIAGLFGGVATMFSGISQAIGSEVLNDEVIRNGVLHVNEKAGTIGQNIQIGKPSQGTWQGLLEGIAGNGHAGVGYTGNEAKVYEQNKYF